MNYKLLKKKINDIVAAQGGVKVDQSIANKSNEIAKSQSERDFFQALRYELKKASDFFSSSEQLYRIRQARVEDGYRMLKEGWTTSKVIDKAIWKMLLSACMKLYRDILLLENFAIMNYCGFSKILKKHDKVTG
jgi:SPX domain protein involved in polyphosphate accumulation